MRLRLDVHHGRVRSQDLAQVGNDGRLVRRELGPLEDDGAVEVPQGVARLAHEANLSSKEKKKEREREREREERGELKRTRKRKKEERSKKKEENSLSLSPSFPLSHRFLHKHVARLPLPLGVVVREQLPDVGPAQRPQDRVRDGVQQRVAVRVRDAAAVVRDLDPAQDQLVVALLEAVEVKAVADSEGEDRRSGGSVDGCCGRGDWSAERREILGGGWWWSRLREKRKRDF